MTTRKRTAAIVGCAGGVGATRLSIEMGATLGRAGHSVAVLDVALATQGLAGYAPGRIDPDATAVLTGSADLSDALVDLGDGLSLCPAHAPFERLARAKTPAAAERFGDVLAAAERTFDYVLIDVPPVATNPAVAAVTEAARIALVAPATERGANAVQGMRGRLADVGASADAVIANEVRGEKSIGSADVAVPRSATTAPAAGPAVVAPDAEFAPAVARATEATVDASLDLEFPEEGLLDGVDEYLPDALS